MLNLSYGRLCEAFVRSPRCFRAPGAAHVPRFDREGWENGATLFYESIDMRQMARRLIASTCRRICFTRAAGRQRSAYFAIFDF